MLIPSMLPAGVYKCSKVCFCFRLIKITPCRNIFPHLITVVVTKVANMGWKLEVEVRLCQHLFISCAPSLREVIQDDNVRPTMQCLMMDSSFSMVTLQGEDSGIAWETTPSRCSTPWASEGGSLAVDPGSPGALRPSTPTSAAAGKIIFVMDEGMMSRRKRSRESDQKRRSDGHREAALRSSVGISERPELAEVSQPNVKPEDGDEDVSDDPPADKEQKLFSLVSEGSEILNIVVPTKLATVDEEESREMVDNLSYLEDRPVPEASEDPQELQLEASTAGPGAEAAVPVRVTDPPGAPVTRPPDRRASGVVDYFEAYTLIDAQAPGGPAVIARAVEPKADVAMETQDSGTPLQTPTTGTTADLGKADTVSLEEFTSELLDEVFYGGTEQKPEEGSDGEDRGPPSKGPSKPSGSILFGGEEDVLTPIFLPDGPPKIIDPILLEEPKAMAFLYTDLYEEAMGCRTKEEDAESVGSEKSFHSRHSDREARGYLEKYVLIDETPVVEMEAADKGNHAEEGAWVLSQELYDYKPEKEILPEPEEEITDFLRSSANSSPCEMEPFERSLNMEETTETKEKTKKVVDIKAEPELENPVGPASILDFECPYEELDWGLPDDHLAVLDIKTHLTDPEVWRDSYLQKPVAPPRKKETSPKTRLDLCPLTPVDVRVKEDAGGKEQAVGERETETVPAKSADEEDAGEPPQTRRLAPSESLSAAAEPTQSGSTEDSDEAPLRSMTPPVDEGDGAEQGTREARGAAERGDDGSSDSNRTTGSPKEKGGVQMPAEAAKEKARCIIL